MGVEGERRKKKKIASIFISAFMRAIERAARETNRSQRKCMLRHSGVEDGEGGAVAVGGRVSQNVCAAEGHFHGWVKP